MGVGMSRSGQIWPFKPGLASGIVGFAKQSLPSAFVILEAQRAALQRYHFGDYDHCRKRS
jgi:hypothetical protein